MNPTRALLLSSLLAGCAATTSEPQVQVDEVRQVVELGEGVTLRRLAGDTWIHVTKRGSDTANGLLVINQTDSLLIDTGWNPAQTAAILAWARDEQFRPVRAAVVTHAHADRMGGIRALLDADIEVTAVSLTAEQARSKMLPEPNDVFEGYRVLPHAQLFFPGAGHSPDNIVVYLPEQDILFGGCLVRSGATDDLGNLEDASVEAWYHAIPKLREKYPNPRIVVPGHGRPGGPELYKHTLELVIAASAKGAD